MSLPTWSRGIFSARCGCEDIVTSTLVNFRTASYAIPLVSGFIIGMLDYHEILGVWIPAANILKDPQLVVGTHWLYGSSAVIITRGLGACMYLSMFRKAFLKKSKHCSLFCSRSGYVQRLKPSEK
jgi:hypothetical protein